MHSKFCQLHNTLGLCLFQNKFPLQSSLDLKDITVISPSLADVTSGSWFSCANILCILCSVIAIMFEKNSLPSLES